MRLVILAVALVMARVAVAGDVALVISNGAYEDLPNIRDVSRGHDDLVRAYQRAGYDVLEGEDLDRDEMRALFQRLEQVVEAADHLVIHYAGHALATPNAFWLLPTDLDPRGRSVTAFGAAPFAPLIEMAALKPGHSAVFLGLPSDELRVASGFSSPSSGLVVPQGVLMVQGEPDALSKAVREDFLIEGRSMAEAARRARNVTVRGYISPDTGLVPDDASPVATPPSTPAPSAPGLVESAVWALADASPSENNLRAYLDRYPNGFYAAEARRKLAALTPAGNPAERAEQALNLSRAARRAVQENLTVLGYDTRGVDGIFGRGTRSAIEDWQGAERLVITGFLNAAQLQLLSERAATRAEQLKSENEQREREQELADIEFWRQTGASGKPADLRAYLNRYPEGIYASEARRTLDRLEDDDRGDASAIERADWDRAREQNTASAYRAYLAKYPRGVFAESAQARIDVLTEGSTNEARKAEYQRIEDALGLNTGSRMLVEQRLQTMDYDPGFVDGNFDDDTRRAIARFQRRQGLPDTGYLNSVTVQRLIVAALR